MKRYEGVVDEGLEDEEESREESREAMEASWRAREDMMGGERGGAASSWFEGREGGRKGEVSFDLERNLGKRACVEASEIAWGRVHICVLPTLCDISEMTSAEAWKSDA